MEKLKKSVIDLEKSTCENNYDVVKSLIEKLNTFESTEKSFANETRKEL